MSRHADAMDAAAYWAQYEVKIAWDSPKEIVGTVEALRETRAKASDPWTPRLAVRQDDGVLVIVDAYQQRLLAELVLAKPVVGDRIKIRYLGEDAKSAPGMNPVKRFNVRVQRAGSPSQERPENPTSGEVKSVSENEPGAGKNPK